MSPDSFVTYLPDRSEELRVVAQHEESMISEVATVDHLEYTDDDLDTLLLHNRAILVVAEHADPAGEPHDRAMAEKHRREIAYLERLKRAESRTPSASASRDMRSASSS